MQQALTLPRELIIHPFMTITFIAFNQPCLIQLGQMLMQGRLVQVRHLRYLVQTHILPIQGLKNIKTSIRRQCFERLTV